MNHLFEEVCDCCKIKKKWCFKTCTGCQYYRKVNVCISCWYQMNNVNYIIGDLPHEDHDLEEDNVCPWATRIGQVMLVTMKKYLICTLKISMIESCKTLYFFYLLICINTTQIKENIICIRITNYIFIFTSF